MINVGVGKKDKCNCLGIELEDFGGAPFVFSLMHAAIH
jgi:hypothetical protein